VVQGYTCGRTGLEHEMTIDTLLDRLEGVRPRGSGKWTARCPAHTDKTPSLSIRLADDGKVLLHDFAGCRLEEILSTLGLRPVDLFPDNDPDPQRWQEQKRQRERERARQAHERRRDGLRIDTLREAEKVIRAARGIDINILSDVQLDTILNRLGDAYVALEGEQFDELAGIV